MKYKVSQIVDRSKRLADIANTSFLTYEELEQYLQDSWTGVYQTMINKGVKAFTKEVELVNAGSAVGDWTEYEIPEDLFQICSLKNKISGSIVPRYAESESINSGSYEVVNNKIRLYGVVASPLLLTYWVVPTFLSFPDEDVEVELNGTVISSAGNSVLYDTGTIVNVKNGETLGSITIKDDYNYQLGNGHVVEHGELETDTDTWTIGDTLLDADLNEIDTPQGTADTPTTISEDVYKYNDKYYYAPNRTGTSQQIIDISNGDYLVANTSTYIYPTMSSPSRTDGHVVSSSAMHWISGDTSRFVIKKPSFTFAYWTWLDEQYVSNTIITHNVDNSEYPDEPQFLADVITDYAPSLTYYNNNPGKWSVTSTTFSGTFYRGYSSDLMNYTIFYYANSKYYTMKDISAGTASSNLVEAETPTSLSDPLTDLTVYTITALDNFIYGTSTAATSGAIIRSIKFATVTRFNTTSYTVVSGDYETILNDRQGDYYLEYLFVYNYDSFVPSSWTYKVQQFYSSMYEITGLTSTSIETEEVTDEDLKYNIYIDTNELSVNYSIYRYYYRGLNYKDYNDNVIFSDDTTGSYSTFLDSEYNVNYQVLEDGEYSTPKLFGTELFEMPEGEIVPRFVAAHEGLFLFSTQVDGNNVLTGYVPELESYIDEYSCDYIPSEIIPVDRFNMERAFLVRTSGNKYRLWHFTDDDYVFTDDRVDIKAPINIALLRYGPLVSNGTNATIKSRIPDTLLDFPNDFFFSIIAVDLAMRFAMKQNADASGLQAQYDTMWFTYMNTLEQDSGYGRITNVYN